MRNVEFTNGELPFDNGDFTTLAEITNLLRKLHSPFALNLEKTYNRLQFLEDKEKIKEGIRAADNGELVDHEEVVAKFTDANPEVQTLHTVKFNLEQLRATIKNAIKTANNNYQRVTAIRLNKSLFGPSRYLFAIPILDDKTMGEGEFELDTQKSVLKTNQADVG